MSIKNYLFLLVFISTGLFGISLLAYWALVTPIEVVRAETLLLTNLSSATADLEEQAIQLEKLGVEKQAEAYHQALGRYHEAQDAVTTITFLPQLSPALASALDAIVKLRNLGESSLTTIDETLPNVIAIAPTKTRGVEWTIERFQAYFQDNPSEAPNGIERYYVVLLDQSLVNLIQILSASRGVITQKADAIGREVDALKSRSTLAAGFIFVMAILVALLTSTFLARKIYRVNERNLREILESKDALVRAKDAADAANRSKGAFLANMSHELRTPMNAILGMNHLALVSEVTPRVRNYLANVDTSARRLLDLLNDILDFSKIEAGKVTLTNSVFSMETLVGHVLDLQSIAAETKNLELLPSFDPQLPSQVVGDQQRITQVLVNLMGNAIKFTQAGEVAINVRALAAREDDLDVEFSVRDTGIGMTAEQRERLFQPFTQADETTTRRFGGTGLGLVISRELCRLMGGSLVVESEPDRGSTFTFHLPLGRAPGEQTKTRPLAPGLRGLRVLVVDDNALSRKILEDLLHSLGFVPVCVPSGGAALDAIRMAIREESPYRLVLLDWRMPGMDGIETARHILSEAGAESAPKMLMITAYARDEYLPTLDTNLFSGIVLKPILPSVLFDAVVGALGAAVSPVPPTPAATPRFGGQRILLVEDQDLNRQVAKELMEIVGLTVDTAADGLEAVEKVRTTRFDLVFMDIQMPVLDGLEAARRIRTEAVWGADQPPIVAMTAHAMEEHRTSSLRAGMQGHLSKPIDPALLYDEVARWIPPLGASGKSRTALENLEIPGIDPVLGLLRTGGEPALYLRALKAFRKEYSASLPSFEATLGFPDPLAAQILCHNLKSSAGIVGAARVQDLAETLEITLRSGQTADPGQVRELVDDMGRILEGLARFEG